MAFDSLDESLRKIAELKASQWTNAEIAEHLNITIRSVQRKLERIRQVWNEVLA